MRPHFWCRRCHRAIWEWPWRDPYCRDFDSCLSEYLALQVDLGLVEEPEPLWDNPPPDDIGVCSMCSGRGEVPLRQDWETGVMEIGECPRCVGSCKDPAWVG